MSRSKVVLVGVGDADTDLMAKAARSSEQLEVTAMTRIGLDSGAPIRAYRLKVTPHTRGAQKFVVRDEFADVQFALHATSAKAQQRRSNALTGHDKHLVGQTSSATGQTVDLGASRPPWSPAAAAYPCQWPPRSAQAPRRLRRDRGPDFAASR